MTRLGFQGPIRLERTCQFWGGACCVVLTRPIQPDVPDRRRQTDNRNLTSVKPACTDSVCQRSGIFNSGYQNGAEAPNKAWDLSHVISGSAPLLCSGILLVLALAVTFDLGLTLTHIKGISKQLFPSGVTSQSPGASWRPLAVTAAPPPEPPLQSSSGHVYMTTLSPETRTRDGVKRTRFHMDAQ